ncbi:MAG: bacillithiol biosynthesis cysteine-adding enzyme BshC [Myxococcaceae bacterium]
MAVPFAPSFIAGDAKAEPFLPRDFARKEKRIEAVKAAARRRAPPEVIAALSGPGAEVLAKGGAAAVITGQQVGLFLGPLYTIYKALTAVAAARALEAESGVRCVPVFWLQTEDHDFAEIDHCHTLDREWNEVSLKLDGGPDSRQSVEHRQLPPQIDLLNGQLADALEGLPHATEVVELLRPHYQSGVSIAHAFKGVFERLMGKEGLTIFDPRRVEISKLTAPLHARAVRDAAAIGELLGRRANELTAAGFDCQIKVRGECPLSFFHPEGPHGPRYRLNRTEAGWSLAGREESFFSTEHLLSSLEKDPLGFSTSALLRPIVQDTLFPTAAYVGGPGEISYFAQLPPLYRHFEVPMPVIAPRARFRLIDARTRRLLEEVKLVPSDIEAPRETLLHKVVHPVSGPTPEAVQADVVAATEQVLQQLDSNPREEVRDALKRTRATIARAAGRLSHRYRRLIETNDHVATQRIDRLQRVLYPHGEPQERVLGFASFAAIAGIEPLKRALFAALDPFGTSIKDVQL